MKRAMAALLALCLLFSLCRCSLFYDFAEEGSFGLGYSKLYNDAFVGSYTWDGTEEGMNIVIPESYNGAPVTALGGYVGRGYPYSFDIELSDEAKELLAPNAIWCYASTSVLEDLTIRNETQLSFRLHISKGIEELDCSAGRYVIAKHEKAEAEEPEFFYDLYVVTCYVTCDAENQTFYAKDGKLYVRGTDELVNAFCYNDFDLEKYIGTNSDD